MNEYKSFADVYDAYMDSFDLSEWYEYIKNISMLKGVKNKRILDLACGSGNLGLLFLSDGAKLTGVDSSSEMLSIFDSKAHLQGFSPRLIHGDMSAISFPDEKFDFVYCSGDGINYLNVDKISSMFSFCAEVLEEGGVFTFDAISPLYDFGAGQESYEGDNFAIKFERTIKDGMFYTKVNAETTFGEVEESYVQYMYAPDFFNQIAEKTGFRVCNSYDFLSFETPSSKSEKFQCVYIK